MTKWGELTWQVLHMLHEIGPMTRAEICVYLGQDKDKVSSIVSRLATDSPKAGKRIYVCDYVYDMEGERRYPRAVYAIGGGRDKPRPKPDPLEVKRRYWARRKALLTANSVFHLGMTRRQTDAYIKERKAA